MFQMYISNNCLKCQSKKCSGGFYPISRRNRLPAKLLRRLPPTQGVFFKGTVNTPDGVLGVWMGFGNVASSLAVRRAEPSSPRDLRPTDDQVMRSRQEMIAARKNKTKK
jgi:hypothetical protein